MHTRVAALLVSGAIFYGCDGNPASATQARLTAIVTPNPMRSPAGPGTDLSWNLELRAAGSGSVLVERGYARLVDAGGRIVGSSIDLWSKSAGCSSCSTDLRIEDGSSMTFDKKQITYIGGESPARFVYSVSFADDLGKGSTTVEVPIHEFAQASGPGGVGDRRSALTMNRFGAGPM